MNTFSLNTTFPGHTKWLMEAAIIAFLCHIYMFLVVVRLAFPDLICCEYNIFRP